MTDTITIKTTDPVHDIVRPPGSKSITNRALICAALADGRSTLLGALDSDDTRVMIAGLQKLGIEIAASNHRTQLEVAGCGGKLPAATADIFVGNSGTTVRFLTALVSLGRGRFRLDGIPRMRQRPIRDMLDTLSQLGVAAESEHGTGAPPVVIQAKGLAGGRATIVGSVSSQFLSGLLMAAPYAADDVQLVVDGQLVSVPYVNMTMKVMNRFGVQSESNPNGEFRVKCGQSYRGRPYDIEPDASAASYFWAAAAITGGNVTVQGLSRNSLQGDVRFCECLEQMGCKVTYTEDSVTVVGAELVGIDVDMNDISDTVQTLSAVALYAKGPTHIRGVAHNRHKETDRIGDLTRELRKFGATVEELEDGLAISPGKLRPATIATYEDHRMAMSMALVGLKTPGVIIEDPGCTSKTYPDFFEDLAALGT